MPLWLAATLTLLNASYDPTRELYQEVNRVFAARWKRERLLSVLLL